MISSDRHYLWIIVIICLTFVQCGGTINDSKDYCMKTSPQHNAMKDGWSKTGLLISGVTNIGGYTMQAKFSAEEEGSGAQYYTIQFGIPQPPANGVFDAIAEINWSTEGTDVRRLISIANGASISGTAQFARVTIIDRTDPAVYVGLTGFEYRVDTLVTPGCRPSEQMPPRLFPASVLGVNVGGRYVIAPATNVQVIVPQNAGIISVKSNVVSAAGSAPVAAGDVDIDMGTGLLFSGSFDPFITDDWVPVPPACSNLILRNRTVGKTIVLNLAFGIEG